MQLFFLCTGKLLINDLRSIHRSRSDRETRWENVADSSSTTSGQSSAGGGEGQRRCQKRCGRPGNAATRRNSTATRRQGVRRGLRALSVPRQRREYNNNYVILVADNNTYLYSRATTSCLCSIGICVRYSRLELYKCPLLSFRDGRIV